MSRSASGILGRLRDRKSKGDQTPCHLSNQPDRDIDRRLATGEGLHLDRVPDLPSLRGRKAGGYRLRSRHGRGVQRANEALVHRRHGQQRNRSMRVRSFRYGDKAKPRKYGAG